MRLVVFDLDGTLIDSHAFITRLQALTFEAEGLPPPTPEAGRAVIGLALLELMRSLSGGDDALVARLSDRYRSYVHGPEGAEAPDELLYEGAFEVLQALYEHSETLLGVATGKGMRGVNRILNMHEIADLFDTLQTPDTNPSKPHPGMLEAAMRQTGASPDRTIMIGDTTFDMEMARSAGTYAIGVSWGSHSIEQLIAAGAHKTVDGFGGLADAVEELLGESNNA